MNQFDDPQSPGPEFRRLSSSFRLIGWLGFWIKSTITALSIVIIIFLGGAVGGQDTSSPASGIALLLVVLGLLLLGLSSFWSYAYTRFSKFFLNSRTLPTRKATLRRVQLDVLTNLGGMILTIIGGEAIIGTITLRILPLVGIGATTVIGPEELKRFVNIIDLLVIQTVFNMIAGQFIGLVLALWLLQRINQASAQQG